MSSVVSWVARRNFDVAAAVLGLLLAAALFPLRFFASQIYIKTIPIILGIGCALYLLTVRADHSRSAPTLSTTTTMQLLPTLVFLGVAALIALAVAFGGRTRPFYAVSGVVVTLLLVQTVFTENDEFAVGLFLVQLLAVAVTVRFAALFTAPGFIGIDIWTHWRLAAAIYDAGSLSAIADNKHYAAPFYHLLVVSTSLLADVSLRHALYLSLGVAMPISVLFVYATTRFLLPARWAAFAATLYAVGDYVVEWSLHLIPTSHGLLLFLGVVYALVRVTQTNYKLRDFALLVVLSVGVVLTHQVSSFIMLVLIGSGLVAQLVMRLDVFSPSPLQADVFRTMGPVNLAGLAVFDAGLVTFTWSLTPYNGDTFLETVLSYLAQTIRSSAGFLNLAGPSNSGGGAAAAQGPTLIEKVALYVDTLGFLLLLCATIVGCLYVLRRERAKHSVFTLLLATVVMVVFVLGLPLFGIRNFIPQRWFAFLYAPMAVLAAVGVRFLAGGLNRRVFVACLVVFSMLYPAVMVTSSHGAIDNPAFPNERARLSYTQQELAAVSTIGRMTGSPDSMNIRPDQVLYTDHPYQTVFSRTGSYPAEPAYILDGQPTNGSITVYREYQSTGASFFINAQGSGQIRDVPPKRVCRPEQSTLYANGDVRMCVAP